MTKVQKIYVYKHKINRFIDKNVYIEKYIDICLYSV